MNLKKLLIPVSIGIMGLVSQAQAANISYHQPTKTNCPAPKNPKDQKYNRFNQKAILQKEEDLITSEKIKY